MSQPFIEPGLGCARCGKCCEEIYLDVAVADMIRDFIGPLTISAAPNIEFIREHWTERSRNQQGQALFSCDAYDAEHKLCTAHDDRPPVCRDFPWYGRAPGDTQGGVITKECSYWLDVHPALRPDGARPLIPLTEVPR